VLSVQPCDAMSHTRSASLAQRLPQLDRPIPRFALAMQTLQILHQLRMGDRPPTEGAGAPSIVAAPTHADDRTEPSYTMLRLMSLDEAILHGDSRAKNTAAFKGLM